MDLKEGAVCPIAALAGKTECLKTACGWHNPPDYECLVLDMVDALFSVEETAKGLNTNIKLLQDFLDKKGKKR